MDWVYDDGGRKAAGFRGHTGDCVTRAIAIATGMPYLEVYNLINTAGKTEKSRRGKIGQLARTGKGSSARTGVYKPTYRQVIEQLGWRWTPTMHVGSGCKVHLKADELPSGRLIASVSRHLTAVIDGVVHDTSDPSRDGVRCVYGYWQAPSKGE